MSRRAAEECISAGRVTVNGRVASLGDRADEELDLILVDGRPLLRHGARTYIMLNKPRGYVTTMSDEKGRRDVTELVRGLGRVYPVGRLDMYSEGLLIMTDDGAFANTLMHPSHNFKKTYRTWVQGEDVGLAVEYLRGELGYDGVVVTEDLDAIPNAYSANAPVQALLAGCDLIYTTDSVGDTLAALQQAVADGTLTEERVNESVYRILLLKCRFGIVTE